METTQLRLTAVIACATPSETRRWITLIDRWRREWDRKLPKLNEGLLIMCVHTQQNVFFSSPHFEWCKQTIHVWATPFLSLSVKTAIRVISINSHCNFTQLLHCADLRAACFVCACVSVWVCFPSKYWNLIVSWKLEAETGPNEKHNTPRIFSFWQFDLIGNLWRQKKKWKTVTSCVRASILSRPVKRKSQKIYFVLWQAGGRHAIYWPLISWTRTFQCRIKTPKNRSD